MIKTRCTLNYHLFGILNKQFIKHNCEGNMKIYSPKKNHISFQKLVPYDMYWTKRHWFLNHITGSVFEIWFFFLAYAVRTLPLFCYSPLVNLIFVRITEREEYYNGIYWSSATFVQVLGYRIYWIEILSFNNSRCTAVSYFVTVVTHAWCPVKWTIYWDCR